MKADTPVRVCFMIDSLSRAGTESQLLALINTLDRQVVEPVLVLLDGEAHESRELEPDNCPVLRLGLRSFRDLPASATAAARLVKYWRQHRCQVLQSFFLDSTYFAIPLARLCGLKTVRVRNNIGHWLTPAHRGLGRVMGRLSHATLTNSEPGRQALWQAERGDRRKIVVLENGVDLERFVGIAPAGRIRGVTFGVVANLRWVKGIDQLIRAAALVVAQRPKCRFKIAGEGAERGKLEALIDELRLRNQVEILGHVADVPAFWQDVDVAVLPSRAEGMSNALLEAMAAGRPVVATTVGSNAEILAQGECGLLVPPNDVTAMTAALVRMIDEPTQARRWAESGRRRVQAQFARQKMRLHFEGFYRRLCA